jgi:hypothetical protein
VRHDDSLPLFVRFQFEEIESKRTARGLFDTTRKTKDCLDVKDLIIILDGFAPKLGGTGANGYGALSTEKYWVDIGCRSSWPLNIEV